MRRLLDELQLFSGIKKIKSDNDFMFDKKRFLLDYIKSFLIIALFFISISIIFRFSNHIIYYIYTFNIAIILSYIYGLYKQDKEFKKEKKLNITYIASLGKPVVNLVFMLSIITLFLYLGIFTPFYNAFDMWIIVFFFILTFGLKIYIDWYEEDSFEEFFKNIYPIFYYLFLIYFMFLSFNYSSSTLMLSIVVTVLHLLVGFIYYFEDHLRFFKADTVLLMNIGFIIIALLIGVIQSPFTISSGSVKVNAFYGYETYDETICEPQIEGMVEHFFIVDDVMFIKSQNKIEALDYSCNVIDSISDVNLGLMYHLDGEVFALKDTQVEEELEAGYNSYQFYQYIDGEFQEQFLAYQFGERPQIIFRYEVDKYAYKINTSYKSDHDKYMQIYSTDIGYGYDKAMRQDRIYYKSDTYLLYREWGRTYHSKDMVMGYSGSRSAYSDDWIIESMGDNKYQISRVSLEPDWNRLPFMEIKIDGRMTYNDNLNMDYKDGNFYIYAKENLYVYNADGDIIGSIPRLSEHYHIVDDYTYYLEEYSNTIKRVPTLHNGDYFIREKTYNPIEFDITNDLNMDINYKFHPYLNYYALELILLSMFIKAKKTEPEDEEPEK